MLIFQITILISRFDSIIRLWYLVGTYNELNTWKKLKHCDKEFLIIAIKTQIFIKNIGPSIKVALEIANYPIKLYYWF